MRRCGPPGGGGPAPSPVHPHSPVHPPSPPFTLHLLQQVKRVKEEVRALETNQVFQLEEQDAALIDKLAGGYK